MVKLVIHLDHDDIVLSGLRRKTADGLKRLYCPAHTALIHREGLAFGRIMMISDDGAFGKLPVEVRKKIWAYTFDDTAYYGKNTSRRPAAYQKGVLLINFFLGNEASDVLADALKLAISVYELNRIDVGHLAHRLNVPGGIEMVVGGQSLGPSGMTLAEMAATKPENVFVVDTKKPAGGEKKPASRK